MRALAIGAVGNMAALLIGLSPVFAGDTEYGPAECQPVELYQTGKLELTAAVGICSFRWEQNGFGAGSPKNLLTGPNAFSIEIPWNTFYPTLTPMLPPTAIPVPGPGTYTLVVTTASFFGCAYEGDDLCFHYYGRTEVSVTIAAQPSAAPQATAQLTPQPTLEPSPTPATTPLPTSPAEHSPAPELISATSGPSQEAAADPNDPSRTTLIALLAGVGGVGVLLALGAAVTGLRRPSPTHVDEGS